VYDTGLRRRHGPRGNLCTTADTIPLQNIFSAIARVRGTVFSASGTASPRIHPASMLHQSLCHPPHANPPSVLLVHTRLLAPPTSQGRSTGHWVERLLTRRRHRRTCSLSLRCPLPLPVRHRPSCLRHSHSSPRDRREIAERCLGGHSPAASSSCAAPQEHSAAGEGMSFATLLACFR